MSGQPINFTHWTLTTKPMKPIWQAIKKSYKLHATNWCVHALYSTYGKHLFNKCTKTLPKCAAYQLRRCSFLGMFSIKNVYILNVMGKCQDIFVVNKKSALSLSGLAQIITYKEATLDITIGFMWPHPICRHEYTNTHAINPSRFQMILWTKVILHLPLRRTKTQTRNDCMWYSFCGFWPLRLNGSEAFVACTTQTQNFVVVSFVICCWFCNPFSTVRLKLMLNIILISSMAKIHSDRMKFESGWEKCNWLYCYRRRSCSFEWCSKSYCIHFRCCYLIIEFHNITTHRITKSSNPCRRYACIFGCDDNANKTLSLSSRKLFMW